MLLSCKGEAPKVMHLALHLPTGYEFLEEGGDYYSQENLTSCMSEPNTKSGCQFCQMICWGQIATVSMYTLSKIHLVGCNRHKIHLCWTTLFALRWLSPKTCFCMGTRDTMAMKGHIRLLGLPNRWPQLGSSRWWYPSYCSSQCFTYWHCKTAQSPILLISNLSKWSYKKEKVWMEQLMIFESSLSFHCSWADAEDDNIAD